MKKITITKQFDDSPKPTIKELSVKEWEKNKDIFLKLGWKIKE